jgi:cell shape-determining protein MreC
MAKRNRISQRWMLLMLMGLSILTALAGPRAADPLRKTFRFFQIMPGDLSMYVVAKLRGGDRPSTKPISQAEAEDLEDRLAVLDYEAAYYYEQMVAYRAEAKELRNFQASFGPAEGLNVELIPARVISDDSVSYGHGRVLRVKGNSGAASGDLVTTRRLVTDRRKTMGKFGVLAGNVLVGRIGESGDFMAELILVTDASFQTHAKIYRDLNNPRIIQGATGEEPLTPENNDPIPCHAVGDGKMGLIIKNVPVGDAVEPGDALVTEIRTAYRPVPVSIGTVEAVKGDQANPSFQTVRVRPNVDLGALRNVYIVFPLPKEGR